MATTGTKGSVRRRTMIKHKVGAVRTTSYDLPPDSFVYGRPEIHDDVGCAEVLHGWVAGKPSRDPDNGDGVDFVKANVAAVSSGHTTAASQRQHLQAVREANATAFQKTKTNYYTRTRVPPVDKNKRYGMASYSDNMGVPELIEGKYTNFLNDDVDYPVLANRKSRGRLPRPAATAASRGHDINSHPAPEPKVRFVPKRLQNVQGKLKGELGLAA